MSKSLQENSIYAKADVNNDGIVSDEEMAMHERLVMLENQDKHMDQARFMALLAMIFVIFVVTVQYTPLVSLERIEATMGFVNTVIVSMLAIVASFIAAGVMHNRKGQ